MNTETIPTTITSLESTPLFTGTESSSGAAWDMSSMSKSMTVPDIASISTGPAADTATVRFVEGIPYEPDNVPNTQPEQILLPSTEMAPAADYDADLRALQDDITQTVNRDSSVVSALDKGDSDYARIHQAADARISRARYDSYVLQKPDQAERLAASGNEQIQKALLRQEARRQAQAAREVGSLSTQTVATEGPQISPTADADNNHESIAGTPNEPRKQNATTLPDNLQPTEDADSRVEDKAEDRPDDEVTAEIEAGTKLENQLRQDIAAGQVAAETTLNADPKYRDCEKGADGLPTDPGIRTEYDDALMNQNEIIRENAAHTALAEQFLADNPRPTDPGERADWYAKRAEYFKQVKDARAHAEDAPMSTAAPEAVKESTTNKSEAKENNRESNGKAESSGKKEGLSAWVDAFAYARKYQGATAEVKKSILKKVDALDKQTPGFKTKFNICKVLVQAGLVMAVAQNVAAQVKST